MLFSLTANFTHAQSVGNLLTDPVGALKSAGSLITNPVGTLIAWSLNDIGAAIAYLLWLLASLCSVFVYLGGTLTNWALDLNSTVLQNPTVTTGWIVTRDLANLGFVLAIILIAFTTILRLESYQTKN